MVLVLRPRIIARHIGRMARQQRAAAGSMLRNQLIPSYRNCLVALLPSVAFASPDRTIGEKGRTAVASDAQPWVTA